MTEIACIECNTMFFPVSRQQRFCCKRCYQKNYQKTHREQCNENSRRSMTKRRMLYPERIKELRDTHRAKPESRIHAAAKSRAWHEANKDYANPRRRIRILKQRKHYPWQLLVSSAKWRSIKTNVPFDLTNEWAAVKWTGKCELTGLPFNVGKERVRSIFSPSIDKIIPELGYVQGNCRFVLWAVNLFKYNDTDDNMYLIANALLSHREVTKTSLQDNETEAQLETPLP